MAASSLGFVPAYAKINLSLEVLTRRDDGYHELASVMQTISWSDTLRFVRADENVPFGAFATVMDAVKTSGITNVSIVTQPLNGKNGSSR